MSMLHEITAAAPRYKKTQRKGRGESVRSRQNLRPRQQRLQGPRRQIRQTRPRTWPDADLRRLPKRGFSNFDFERRFYIVNLFDIEQFEDGSTVDTLALLEKGLIPDDKLPVKILGDGEFTKKLTIVADWYSKSAHARLIDGRQRRRKTPRASRSRSRSPRKIYPARSGEEGQAGRRRASRCRPRG